MPSRSTLETSRFLSPQWSCRHADENKYSSLELFGQTITLRVYVDDIKARAREKQRQLIALVPQLVDTLVEVLAEVGVEASLGKQGNACERGGRAFGR